MIDTWKVLRFSFRFCCGVVTLIMVGYWIFKFKKNEDVSTIEYKDVNESSDLRLPEMTICLGRKTLSDADLNFEGYIDIRDYVQQVQKEKTREDFIKQQSNYKTTNRLWKKKDFLGMLKNKALYWEHSFMVMSLHKFLEVIWQKNMEANGSLV